MLISRYVCVCEFIRKLMWLNFRWNNGCVSQLPDCMKSMYRILLDTCHELEEELATEGRSYAVHYLQNEVRYPFVKTKLI